MPSTAFDYARAKIALAHPCTPQFCATRLRQLPEARDARISRDEAKPIVKGTVEARSAAMDGGAAPKRVKKLP